MKPIQIEIGEWLYMGCFIQEQKYPGLLPFVIFDGTEQQNHIDTCMTFEQAKKIAEKNKIENPYYTPETFGFQS